jgi:hypothetical protein
LPGREPGGTDGVPDPSRGGHAPKAQIGAVEPALQPEVGALGRPRFHVAAIDPHRRWAEKTLALGSLERLDSPEMDLLVDLDFVEQLAQSRQEGLVVGTAIEIQHLDPHRFASELGAAVIGGS